MIRKNNLIFPDGRKQVNPEGTYNKRSRIFHSFSNKNSEKPTMIFNNEEQSLSKILQITKETNKTEEKSELRVESLENEQENRSF